jgi:hypothetical protein
MVGLCRRCEKMRMANRPRGPKNAWRHGLLEVSGLISHLFGMLGRGGQTS